MARRAAPRTAAARAGTARGGTARAERLEWALGAASGFLVLALVAYLVVEGVTGNRTPPRLTLATAPLPPDALAFTLRNDGGRAATAVALSLRLGDGGERRVVIDYRPGHSEASGAFVLPAGAGAGAAVVVEGYVDP